MADIKKLVFSGLLWKYAERMSAQVVTLVVSIVLARILSPEEYGVVAIIMVFITFANVLVTSGMGTSLIQKKNADEKDFSTVFWGNLIFSIVLYGLLFVCAPLIAEYYDIPILCNVLRVMAVNIIVTGINNIQQSYINKKLEFRRFFFATLAGVIASAIIGIGMAYAGYGVWALVTQTLSNTIINTMVLFVVSDWRPRMYFSWKRFKELFKYGWKILATGILLEVNTEIRDLIIGKQYKVIDLSYINKSKEFPKAISTNINATISSVIFPAMALYQDDREMLKRMSRKSIRMGTYILTPFLFGLAAVADSFIVIVLTEKWLPCVVYLRLMCVQYALQPIQTSSIQAMKAIGKSEVYLRLQMVKSIVGIGLLILSVACFDSPIMVIGVTVFAEFVATVINFPTNKRIMNYNYLEQVRDSFIMMIPSAIMYIIVYAFHYIHIQPLATLIIQILVGIVVYILISWVFQIKEFKYILGMVLKKRKDV